MLTKTKKKYILRPH